MIHFDHIDKIYPHPSRVHHALKDIHFSVEAGDIFGIIGQSGAGKSTLIRLANFLERPSSGDVILNGQPLSQLNSTQLAKVRQSIGMIFQHFNLLDARTVADNIALPLELKGMPTAHIKQKVAELIDLVGLHDKATDYPQSLSGGQKQRVAIARALATEPTLLLCDEATSALDPETTANILTLLKKINQELGITLLLITHEMGVIKAICNRVGVLEQGKLVEVAAVVDLFATPTSPAAKRLTSADMHLSLPQSVQSHLNPHQTPNTYPLIRFVFRGKAVGEPILTTVLDAHHLHANILQANIDTIGGETLGITLCQIMGETSIIQKALRALEQQPVEMEVLGYVNAHLL